MSKVTPNDFREYFLELTGRDPYDWQVRLADRAVTGSWPGAIDLPTGSGKTACLDIAVFALACQADQPKEKRTAPRRLFFCVNRRVIVDEAYQRAVRIARKLAEAEGTNGVLGRVAAALRTLSTLRPESAPPLDVLELRGGIYRDNRWARSATQPTIICTTIDQLGSRLLFRGYGVSPSAAPVHAALIAYDSLVLLDEAHISRPFLQTLEQVKRYLDPERWADHSIGIRPMIVVPMTATPPQGVPDDDVIRLSDKDRANPTLRNRLTASKQAKLLSVCDVIPAAVEQARAFAKAGPAAVGIIVNRVATARAIYDQLRDHYKDQPGVVVELVIGSMRPVDRDRQTERLNPLVGPTRPEKSDTTSFVVSTQCLEVGADYDFDALVTECASLDALRQRFGRLNRGGRPIEAQAVILAANLREENKLDDAKSLDPIYGNALARTWHWLNQHAQTAIVRAEPETATKRTRRKTGDETVPVIDFGIDAFDALLKAHGEGGRIPAGLLAPSALRNAPVMTPAYVDFWCQTNPRPTPDPDVSLFIHGPQADESDVYVCWRADLIENDRLHRDDWTDVVALLPPTAAECMSVPISRARRWLACNDDQPEGDLLGTTTDSKKGDTKPLTQKPNPDRVGVLWRGMKDSRLLNQPDELRPGDTLVLPAKTGGWDQLGHIPNSTIETIDIAETAYRATRDHAILRLHYSLRDRLPQSEDITRFLQRIADPENEPTTAELRTLLEPIARSELRTTRYTWDYYPDERGIVVRSRDQLSDSIAWAIPETDDGNDEWSQTLSDRPITLDDHTQHVRDEVLRTIDALPLRVRDDPNLTDEVYTSSSGTNTAPDSCVGNKISLTGEVYKHTAEWHDLGKADERFQALLRRTDRTDAWLWAGRHSVLLAKSDGLPLSPYEFCQARDRAGLPNGYRHEMVSLQIVEHTPLKEKGSDCLDLILHLIAAHHGYARPFAPYVEDDEAPDVTVNGVTLTSQQRKEHPPYRIDSGIAERFWTLTHRYGWWGLAYLEAIFRLADQQASADESKGVYATGNGISHRTIVLGMHP